VARAFPVGVAVVVAVLFAGCASGGDAGAARLDRFVSTTHALHLDGDFTPSGLRTFATTECNLLDRAARGASDTRIVGFKARYVARAYNAGDQVAIEGFRTLFRLAGHVVCPALDRETARASAVLL